MSRAETRKVLSALCHVLPTRILKRMGAFADRDRENLNELNGADVARDGLRQMGVADSDVESLIAKAETASRQQREAKEALARISARSDGEAVH